MSEPRKYKDGWSVTAVYLEDEDKEEIRKYAALRGISMGEYFREIGRKDRRRRHYALRKLKGRDL